MEPVKVKDLELAAESNVSPTGKTKESALEVCRRCLKALETDVPRQSQRTKHLQRGRGKKTSFLPF